MVEFTDRRLTPRGRAGARMQVASNTAGMFAEPEPGAELVSEALFGEVFTVYEHRDGFIRGQLETDRYVGWVAEEALVDKPYRATHRVSHLRTYVFSEPDLKSTPSGLLSLNAQVKAGDVEGEFIECNRIGWVFNGHLSDVETFERDPAYVATWFMHSPYLWGGCEGLGLDCTGLTRAAFGACGVKLPRDSDMQFAWAGEPVEDWDEPGKLKRNDLVFWKGHVGIMLDSKILLHANAHHMAVAYEPLTDAIERIAKTSGEPVGARRIDIELETGKLPEWYRAVTEG